MDDDQMLAGEKLSISRGSGRRREEGGRRASGKCGATSVVV